MKMRSMCSFVALAVCLAGQAAQAQEVPAPSSGSDASSETIVVTGSRIARRDYVAQSPIVTQSAEVLQQSGASTVDAALIQLPQFQPGQGSFTNSSAGGQNLGLSSLNLRSLGAPRTLVLLDGRRAQPGNGLGVIDINSLPSSAIAGVEVITGGASATYGSDAIAGVVNFKLYHSFDGIRLDAKAGVSDKGDAQSYQASIIAGTKFADGRGSVMIAGEYQQRELVGFTDRSWSTPSKSFSNVLGNGAFVPGTNAPLQSVVDTVFSKYGVASGSVLRTDQLGFNQDGTLFRNRNVTTAPLNYKASSNPCMVVDATTFAYDGLCLNLHQLPLERYAGLGRLQYEISPAINAFVQVQYSNVTARGRGSNPVLAPVGATGFTVPVTNPFIPADLRTILASRANPTAGFVVSKRFVDNGPRSYIDKTETYQIVAGLQGSLPLAGWTFELYGSTGHMKARDDVVAGANSIAAIQRLLTAADGGASLCAGGLNFFGPEPTSAACQAYIARPTVSYSTADQDELAFNAQGGLFNLPYGEVKLALSAAYRKNSISSTPDSAISAGDIAATTATQPLAGSTSVTEGAAELLVPLLARLPLIESLNFTGAYRYSKYNLAGGVDSWKAGFDWRVVPSLMFRGGYQSAVRAPSAGELFQPLQGAIANLGNLPAAGDPCDVRSNFRTGSNGASVRTLCLAQGVPTSIIDTFNQQNSGILSSTAGNLALKPETAKTLTLGAVFQPDFLGAAFSKMSLSVDYYRIDLENVIASIDVATAVGKCFNTDGSNKSYDPAYVLCSNITRDPATGLIVNSISRLQNLGAYKTAGVDIVFDWALPLSSVGIGGDNTLRFNVGATYLDYFDIQVNPGGQFAHFAGTITTPLPNANSAYAKWKTNTTVELDTGAFSFGVKWLHLSSFKDVSTATNPASTVAGTPKYDVFDLFAKVKVGDRFELRGGVNNVADRAPPVVGGFNLTNPGVYDPIGRSFFIGFKAKI